GATPVALLVGLAAPRDLPVAWAQDFVSGMAAECARTGATVVGGDVSSADAIMLAVTALGDLAGREPVTRAGARPGDLLAAAARLGAAGPAGPAERAESAGQGGGPARALVWMLTGGEDHALAATFPPGATLPARWQVIGRVTEGQGVSVNGRPFRGRPG